MTATRIHLLGAPRLERQGRAQPGPRGHKAWALLAYLVLARQPPSRRRLAELLFSTAEDPLGALRWSLAQLRSALQQPDALQGDPLALALGAGTEVDLLALRAPALPAAEALEGAGGELLEGMAFDDCPAFEAWLAAERRGAAGLVQSLLLERAQAELAAGRGATAARLAARLVELGPYEEGHHELLVRALLATGDRAGALARAEACGQLLWKELGVRASQRLTELARTPAPAAPRVSGAAGVRAQLEAGQAAVRAGAVDAGLVALRGACQASEGCGDQALQARAHLALGGALTHGMRGHGEAALALQRAADLARRAGLGAVASAAHRELGYVDVQAGRRQRAEAWLALAAEEAGAAEAELAAIACVRGMSRSDAGRYQEALDALDESARRAEACRQPRDVAHALTLSGRTHAVRGELGPARAALERALRLVDQEKWLGFQPLPEAFLGAVELAEGRLEAGAAHLEHAFAVGCQLGDCCFEALAARGLGLLEAARGHPARAMAWLTDAQARCLRVAHPYLWIHGQVLDSLCAQAPEDELAPGWAAELEALAARTEMRDLLVRAHLHRARRGDARAGAAARALAAEVDSPALARALA